MVLFLLDIFVTNKIGETKIKRNITHLYESKSLGIL